MYIIIIIIINHVHVVTVVTKRSLTILCKTFTRHQKDWCSLWNTIISGERSSFIPWTYPTKNIPYFLEWFPLVLLITPHACVRVRVKQSVQPVCLSTLIITIKIRMQASCTVHVAGILNSRRYGKSFLHLIWVLQFYLATPIKHTYVCATASLSIGKGHQITLHHHILLPSVIQ